MLERLPRGPLGVDRPRSGVQRDRHTGAMTHRQLDPKANGAFKLRAKRNVLENRE
jgi:hypothetical protein